MPTRPARRGRGSGRGQRGPGPPRDAPAIAVVADSTCQGQDDREHAQAQPEEARAPAEPEHQHGGERNDHELPRRHPARGDPDGEAATRLEPARGDHGARGQTEAARADAHEHARGHVELPQRADRARRSNRRRALERQDYDSPRPHDQQPPERPRRAEQDTRCGDPDSARASSRTPPQRLDVHADTTAVPMRPSATATAPHDHAGLRPRRRWKVRSDEKRRT